MRPNIGTNGKTIPLRANYFKVKIPDTDLHHYDVDIRPDKCPRRVNREIIENMVENFRSRIFQVLIFTYVFQRFLQFHRIVDRYSMEDEICIQLKLFQLIDKELN